MLAVVLVLLIAIFIHDWYLYKPTITVENIRISRPYGAAAFMSYKYDDRDIECCVAVDQISKNDAERLIKNKAKIRAVIVTYKIDNKSLFNNIHSLGCKYSAPSSLPPIIIGDNPELVDSLDPVNLPGRVELFREGFQYSPYKIEVIFPIDPRNYTDQEILDILKLVKITLTEYSQLRGENIDFTTRPISTEDRLCQ